MFSLIVSVGYQAMDCNLYENKNSLDSFVYVSHKGNLFVGGGGGAFLLLLKPVTTLQKTFSKPWT